MKWSVPDDLPVVVADADGVVEECKFCGGTHQHGSVNPDSDFQQCQLLGPGYYYANIPTRSSHCPEYEGDYLLAFGLGEDHPYLTDSERREYPEERKHDTYKEDHWRVLDVEDIDKVFSTPSKDGSVRVDIDGHAAPSVMRDLADERDNVNVSAWLSVDYAEELVEQLSEAIEEAKENN